MVPEGNSDMFFSKYPALEVQPTGNGMVVTSRHRAPWRVELSMRR